MDFIIGLFAISDVTDTTYSGDQSWVYYLMGAFFVLFTLISAYYSYRYRNSRKEYENLTHMFGEFKRFWYLNRQTFFILLTIICLICSVVFFAMNGLILNKGI